MSSPACLDLMLRLQHYKHHIRQQDPGPSSSITRALLQGRAAPPHPASPRISLAAAVCPPVRARPRSALGRSQDPRAYIKRHRRDQQQSVQLMYQQAQQDIRDLNISRRLSMRKQEQSKIKRAQVGNCGPTDEKLAQVVQLYEEKMGQMERRVGEAVERLRVQFQEERLRLVQLLQQRDRVIYALQRELSSPAR